MINMKKTIWIGMALLAIMLTLQNVQALGVTRPIPYDVQLQNGEKAGFVFEIQAVTSQETQLCSYSITGLDPLQVTFDESEAIVNAGDIREVYGTVTVPSNAEIKTYSGRLTISCGAYTEGQVSGSVVKTTVGGSPFSVKVVEVRTQDIREIAPPKAAGFDYLTIIIIAAIIIIIAVIAVFMLKRKK